VAVGSSNTSEYVGIWNTSKNILEGIVQRKDSSLIQHRVAVGSFLMALDERGIKAKGYLHNQGGKVVLVANFSDFIIGDGTKSGVTLGIKIENSYCDCKGPRFSGIAAGWRGNCENEFSLGKSVSACFQKHGRLADLEKSMRSFVDRVIGKVPAITSVIDSARKESFASYEEVHEVGLAAVKNKKKVESILNLIENKRDLTRYSVYNSFTNYATHVAKDDKEEGRLQRIAEKILITPVAKLKKVQWD